MLPIVHPYFCYPGGILVDDFGYTSRKRVRRFVTEHVTDMRTRTDLQHAATLPDLVAQLNHLFSSTDASLKAVLFTIS